MKYLANAEHTRPMPAALGGTDPISKYKYLNPLMPVGNYSYQFFICCPRDCVSRQNGDTSGAPLKPHRVDSVLRALST